MQWCQLLALGHGICSVSKGRYSSRGWCAIDESFNIEQASGHQSVHRSAGLASPFPQTKAFAAASP
eukprot:scaffold7159_cov18-Tisochrysis_lutea.AAC.2